MAEYRALNKVLGHSELRMNSTKSMIGHLLGGAGAVEAVATIKAIQTGATRTYRISVLMCGRLAVPRVFST